NENLVIEKLHLLVRLCLTIGVQFIGQSRPFYYIALLYGLNAGETLSLSAGEGEEGANDLEHFSFVPV
ncbi:hypothetical protein ABNF65_22120, partial [Paenibacillus larvae]